MQFIHIPGHKDLKKRLIDTVKNNRISHAQLFLGQEGVGKLTLAVAYAQYINCENPKEDDSCGVCKSCKKFEKIVHPDLHFVYPVAKTPKISNPVSIDFINIWREFLLGNKFHSYNDWMETIGTENSQGSIYAQESQEIIRIVNLKTFEAKYKTIIIYYPEKLNISTSNKLLKAIEEPPPNTLFILVSEDETQIITTIRSRTQLIKISLLEKEEITEELKKEFSGIDEVLIQDAVKISNCNYVFAKKIITQETSAEKDGLSLNFELFSKMMRLAYNHNFKEIVELVEEIAKLGREKQKNFMLYSLRFSRENFILNVNAKNTDISYITNQELQFANNFCRFINQKNIFLISEQLDKAYYDIMRNGNAKLIFMDLILQIAKYIKLN